MSLKWSRSLLLAGAVSLAFAATATAAAPTPTAVNGHPVTVVATGIAPGTSFASDPATGTIFVGAYGDPEHGNAGGGVYALSAAGVKTQVAGIPSGVSGIIFSSGTLYVATNPPRAAGKLIAYSGWNGSAFASSKTIFDARKTVGSLNGIALSPNGRIYGGGGLINDVNRKGKVKKSRFPHNPYSVYSIKTDGTGFKIVARGLRQPWQMTFVQGNPNPFVSNLSQDAGKVPPDAIVVAKPHSNFGFPKCFAHVGINCHRHYDQPLIKLRKHASPMGIQAIGNQLYVVLFGGLGKGPEVVTMPAKRGAKPQPFVTGFGAPIVGLGIINGQMYIGDVAGNVWKVAL
jgi:glucose/arabinose dehydrogenase